MIKKIVGFVLVLILFFFAIKAITFLPYFTNLVVGNNKSPFQIGTDYVSQINQIYPYQSYGKPQTPQAAYNTGATPDVLGKVTLQKISGKLVLSIENANPKVPLRVWLTNTRTITDKTEYVDFGELRKSTAVQQYVVDMRGGDISLAEYSTVLIVDGNATVYATIVLK
jgi:hypothetical protein